jgi:hypothetical protein
MKIEHTAAEDFTVRTGTYATVAECARPRCTLHVSSTVASVALFGAAANPARGGLSIDRPPLIEHPFCFSSARRRTAHVPVHKPAAAPMKNKKEDVIRAYSINRSPLTGLEHAKTAEGSGESGHFLSVFCTSHDACKVQRPRAQQRRSALGPGKMRPRSASPGSLRPRTGAARCSLFRAPGSRCKTPLGASGAQRIVPASWSARSPLSSSTEKRALGHPSPLCKDEP